MAVRPKIKPLNRRKGARPRFGLYREQALWIERDTSLHFSLYTRQVWLGDLANEMKDTLKQLLVDCLNASKKGGSGGGVDPSKFPSQVVI